MRYTDHRTLIDRGRKAGLGTAELYRAIAGRPPEAGERNTGATDGNGFVSEYDGQGHLVFHPIEVNG